MRDTLYSEDVLSFLPEDEADFRWKFGLDSDHCPEQVESTDAWRAFKELDRQAAQLLKWARRLEGADRELLGEELDRFAEETFDRDAFHHGAIVVRTEEGSTHVRLGGDGELEEADARYRLTAREFVRQVINFRLTERELERATAMTDRALELLRLLATAESERTRAYLNRVATCYLLGLETEGTVMCRSVLEAACERIVADEEIIAAGYAERNPTLRERLRYLHARAGLDDPSYRRADEIRERGNDAVHTAPGMTDLKDTLEKLVLVLDELTELG